MLCMKLYFGTMPEVQQDYTDKCGSINLETDKAISFFFFF